MSEDTAQEKTEDPTPRRREKFRERGQVASSQELAAGLMLLASTGALWILTSVALGPVYRKLKHIWAICHETEMFVSAPLYVTSEIVIAVVMVMIPVFAITFLAGIFSYVVQTGCIWATEPLKPSFDTLNVINGIQEVFLSKDTLAEIVKTLAKLVLIGGVAAGTLYFFASNVTSLTKKSPEAFAAYLEKISIFPLFACAITMIVVGVADFFWQVHQMEQEMKMTPRQKKREKKESEGDPHQNQKREEKHRELLDVNKLIDEVPESDVVINNPTHYSVALKYEPDEGAPRVVAKGVDYRARKIREIAEEHDIPQVENPPLARALHSHVQPDEQIPEEFYKAVANVLAYVWRQSGNRPEHLG